MDGPPAPGMHSPCHRAPTRSGATASYEPVVGMLMDEEERADLMSALVHGRAMVEQGDLPGAMRAFAAHPFTPDDIAAAADAGYFEATGRCAPHVLRVFQQLAELRRRDALRTRRY